MGPELYPLPVPFPFSLPPRILARCRCHDIDVVVSAAPSTMHQCSCSVNRTQNDTLKPSTRCSKCKAYPQLRRLEPVAYHCSIWVRHRRCCLHRLLRFCPATHVVSSGATSLPSRFLAGHTGHRHFTLIHSLSLPHFAFTCLYYPLLGKGLLEAKDS